MFGYEKEEMLEEMKTFNYEDIKKFYDSYKERKEINLVFSTLWKIGIKVVGVIVILAVSLAAGCPTYKVWSQGMKGKAELSRAQQNRQIKVEEALAIKDSAVYKAEAEVERAKGVDEANKIIAESLGGPEGYLRYLYIDALQNTSCETIYVPTEANLPIMESVRPIRARQN